MVLIKILALTDEFVSDERWKRRSCSCLTINFESVGTLSFSWSSCTILLRRGLIAITVVSFSFHLSVAWFLSICLQIPYVLIFIGPTCQYTVVDYFNLGCDLLFMVDVLINFNSAYLDDSAVLVKDHKTIASHYLR